MLQKATVRLLLFKNIYALHKAVEKLFLLGIGKTVVKLVEVQKKLIDVVFGNPVLTDVKDPGLRFFDLLFYGTDLVIKFIYRRFSISEYIRS